MRALITILILAVLASTTIASAVPPNPTPNSCTVTQTKSTCRMRCEEGDTLVMQAVSTWVYGWDYAVTSCGGVGAGCSELGACLKTSDRVLGTDNWGWCYILFPQYRIQASCTSVPGV